MNTCYTFVKNNCFELLSHLSWLEEILLLLLQNINL